MKNGIILYSKNNLDSAYAASIILSIMRVIEKDSAHYIAQPYNRLTTFLPPKDQDDIFILGADISPLAMGEIIRSNPNATIRLANYENSEVYPAKISKHFTQTLKTEVLQEKTNEELNANLALNHEIPETLTRIKSVSELVLSVFSDERLFLLAFPNHQPCDISNLMNAVTKYCQFERMNLSETLLVFKNTQNIYNYLLGEASFEFTQPCAKDHKEYNTYFAEERKIIDRNFSRKFFNDGGDGIITPTLAINEERALGIMRYVEYSYDDVVTYEDTTHCRVYRILTEHNLDWYTRCLKPFDKWSEGAVVYMVTAVPLASV